MPVGTGGVSIDGQTVRSFRDLVELIDDRLNDDLTVTEWAGRAIGGGTVRRVRPPAVRRRRPPRRPDPGRRRAHDLAPGRPRRQPGHRGRHPQPQRSRQALRRRRGAPAGVRGQGALRHGRAAPVRGARRAQQVRAPRRVVADQGAAARRGRAGPVARHHPDRRPADGERGRAARRGQLGHPRRGPTRLRRSVTGRVRLAAAGAAAACDDHQAGHDDREPAAAARAGRHRVPVPRVGDAGVRDGRPGRADGRATVAGDPFEGL